MRKSRPPKDRKLKSLLKSEPSNAPVQPAAARPAPDPVRLSFPIGSKKESVKDFIARIAPLLRSTSTVIYMDTSFAMWLMKGGAETRSQFVEWARRLDGRIHVPVWTYHEFYRHHQLNTVRSELLELAGELKIAAGKYVQAAALLANQSLPAGFTEEHFPRELASMQAKINEVLGNCQTWEYEGAASQIADWLSEHLCQSEFVFDLMGSLEQVGAVRFTQDMPPGFLDRTKKDTDEKGSNRYGDLILWQEILAHVPAPCKTVVLLTKDRKSDWFADSEPPVIDADMKWIRSRWDPVPAPHPTLELELSQRTPARRLVLLDNLYLGSVLWATEPKKYRKLIAYALGVSLIAYERSNADLNSDEPHVAGTEADRRLNPAQTRAAINAALGPPRPGANGLATRIFQAPHEAEERIQAMTLEALSTAGPPDLAGFARLAAHEASGGDHPSAPMLAEKLLSFAAAERADVAIPIFIGFLAEAYFEGKAARDVPSVWNLQGVFDLIERDAFEEARGVFAVRLKDSRALYKPARKIDPLFVRFIDDAGQNELPLTLRQVLIDEDKALLAEISAPLPSNLRLVLKANEAPVQTILHSISERYGLPYKLLQLVGPEPMEVRALPEALGFLSVDLIAAESSAAVVEVEDAELDAAEDGHGHIDEDDVEDGASSLEGEE